MAIWLCLCWLNLSRCLFAFKLTCSASLSMASVVAFFRRILFLYCSMLFNWSGLCNMMQTCFIALALALTSKSAKFKASSSGRSILLGDCCQGQPYTFSLLPGIFVFERSICQCHSLIAQLEPLQTYQFFPLSRSCWAPEKNLTPIIRWSTDHDCIVQYV